MHLEPMYSHHKPLSHLVRMMCIFVKLGIYVSQSDLDVRFTIKTDESKVNNFKLMM